MGEYNITLEEFKDEFEKFLRGFEGNVLAQVVTQAWNELAKKYGWEDRLGAFPPESIASCQKINLLPEEIIILKTERHLSGEQLAEIKKCAEGVFGKDRKIVILEDMEMKVVSPLESTEDGS